MTKRTADPAPTADRLRELIGEAREVIREGHGLLKDLRAERRMVTRLEAIFTGTDSISRRTGQPPIEDLIRDHVGHGHGR